MNAMKLNNSHLNVLLYLLTLAAAAAYLILRHPERGFLTLGGVLLVAFLLLLALRGFSASFSSTLPIFAAFWGILYAALPIADTFSGRMAVLGTTLSQFFSALLTTLPVLLASVVALFLLGRFAKDSKHFLVLFLRYLFYGVILGLICMAAVYAVLPVEREVFRAVLLGPVFFGGICLCLEVVSSLRGKYLSHISHFFWLTLCFSLLTLIFGPTAMWQLERILLGTDHRVLCAAGVALLGVLLLTQKNSTDDFDLQDKGYYNQILACFFFLWSAYSMLTLAWPQFFHQGAFFFGAPLAYVLYVFLRRFHGNALPLMQKKDNSFLAAYCASALVLMLALGRTITLRPRYLLLVVALLVARYVCAVLATKTQRPLVMRCFWGVAVLLLLTGARLGPEPFFIPQRSLVGVLVCALFWCLICSFLEKASVDSTRIYPAEYAVVTKIYAWTPVLLAVLALLCLLFR